MLINKPVDRSSNNDFVAYVCVGDGPRAGEIKSVHYNYNKSASHMLTIKFIKTHNQVTGIKSVAMDEALASCGWFLVEEEYDRLAKEDPDGGWAEKKAAFLQYKADENAGLVRRPSFPEYLLPPKVLERKALRSAAESRKDAWDDSKFAHLRDGKPKAAAAEAEEAAADKPKRGRPRKAPESTSTPEPDADDLPLPSSL